MYSWKKFYRQTALLLIMALLAGCGTPTQQTGNDVTVPEVTLEPEDLSAGTEDVSDSGEVPEKEIPVVPTKLLVNQIGYEADSDKSVVIRGATLTTEFTIVDAVTEEIVFTGTPEDLEYDEASGEYIGYGDFSALTDEGEFFVQYGDMGRSYSFVIEEGLYQELMENTMELLTEKRASYTSEDILEVCRSLSLLLLSYELYGEVYEANVPEGEVPTVIAEAKDCVEWLLTMQDAESGAVTGNSTEIDRNVVAWNDASESSTAEEQDMVAENVTEDKQEVDAQTAWFAAVLARFSYNYGPYDSDYAKDCLKAADKAWKFLDKEEEAIAKEIFYAVAELYRTTGKYQYRKIVNNLGKTFTPDMSNEALVLGALTYASTERKVNMDLCATFIDALLKEAEQFVETSGADTYWADSGVAGEDFLWKMVKMSVANYIITNKEYAAIIANGNHYLAGVNEDAACYIIDERRDKAASDALEESSVNFAAYIMLLSEMLSHKQEE